MAGAVGGTIGGVIITQRRSDRREAIAWERQQQRERDAQAREETARTFEHRREAYANFYTTHQAMAMLIYNHGVGIDTRPEGERILPGDLVGRSRSAPHRDDPPWDWQFPMYKLLQQVELYGSTSVSEAAHKAYAATFAWGNKTGFEMEDEDFYFGNMASNEAAAELRTAIRRDLSIPDDDFTATIG